MNINTQKRVFVKVIIKLSTFYCVEIRHYQQGLKQSLSAEDQRSQLPVTPAPGPPVSSSGLGGTCSHISAHMHTNIPSIIF